MASSLERSEAARRRGRAVARPQPGPCIVHGMTNRLTRQVKSPFIWGVISVLVALLIVIVLFSITTSVGSG